MTEDASEQPGGKGATEFKPVVKVAACALLAAAVLGSGYVLFNLGYNQGYREASASEKVAEALNEAAVRNLTNFMQSSTASDDELEAMVQQEIEKFLATCPKETVAEPEHNAIAKELADLDRRAERLMDAFAESDTMPSSYLQKALDKLERQRELLMEKDRREKARVNVPGEIIFSRLAFEEKKAVAAQLIRHINVSENVAEIIWNV